MSDLDERIRKAFEGATAPADPAGAYERITRKRARRRVIRRAQTVALTVTVIVVTSSVTFSLGRMFGSRRDETATPTQKPTPAADIAFAGEVGGDPGIYAMRADGTHVRPLTKDPGRRIDPSWSPDGTQLAFGSDRDGDLEIYVLDVASGEERQVTDNPADDTSPAWSPDGTKLAFVSQRDGGTHLYMIDADRGEADGSVVTRLTAGGQASNYDPAWSVDGTQIYFALDPVDGAEESSLYVLDVPSAGDPEPTVPTPWSEDGPTAYQPAPSPDGDRIAFVSVQGDTSQIFVANADGTDVFQVTEGSATKSSPSWSPDGEQIVFSAEGEDQNDLFVVNADGSDMRPISFPGDDVTPVWNPAAEVPAPNETPDDRARCFSENQAAADTSLRKPGSLRGDVDGDGSPDDVFVAVDPQGEPRCRYFVIVETSGFYKAARIDPRVVGPDEDALAIEALVDIDDRPGLEIVVQVWRSATTESAVVFRMTEGIPIALKFKGPRTIENAFTYGGGGSGLFGVDCTGKAGVIVVSTAHPEPKAWPVVRNYFRLEGDEFRPYPQTERHRIPVEELEVSSLAERFPEFAGIAFPSCPGAVRAGG